MEIHAKPLETDYNIVQSLIEQQQSSIYRRYQLFCTNCYALVQNNDLILSPNYLSNWLGRDPATPSSAS